ncbi:MAG: hypothetical protein FJX76_17880 [Armatimonadetes bacterium]|nr:hypothetical protein [Armatimonadota bacterium]
MRAGIVVKSHLEEDTVTPGIGSESVNRTQRLPIRKAAPAAAEEAKDDTQAPGAADDKAPADKKSAADCKPASADKKGAQPTDADIDLDPFDGKMRVIDLERLLDGELSLEDLEPPTGPVADSYATLEKAGLTTTEEQVRRTIKNGETRRETLVLFKEKPGKVFSVATADDVDRLAAFKSGAGLSTEDRALADGLAALEQRGGTFVFQRDGHWLPTDATGAAVLVARGETVSVLDKYGEVAVLGDHDAVAEKAAQTPAPSPALDATADAVAALDQAGFGVGLEQALPDDVQVTDFKKIVKHQLKEMASGIFSRQDPLGERKAVLDKLAAGGACGVSPAQPEAMSGGAEPKPTELPEPMSLDARQVQSLSRIAGGAPDAAEKQFLDDMEAIRKNTKSLVLSRDASGMQKGALHKANDLKAWLNMMNGGEIVLLAPDGVLTRADTPAEVHEMATSGKIARAHRPPVDPAAPKTNLLMLYFNSPFNPEDDGGIYEDLPLRATGIGSNDQADHVVLRSDLPKKKNLRSEYVQHEDLQLIKALDAKTLMNDPKTLEAFVYESLKAHPDNKHLRLMVAGHGGAELGLLPDGDANDASAHGAMSVDDFADAVHRGLERFNKETGKSRKIDNLIVGSCLMGNTSFIHALAKRGDIKVLSASPEVLMGNDPLSVFSYLSDPRTADKDAKALAEDMVDLTKGAASFPGGKGNMQFADTYGAYDLDPAKSQQMEKDMDGFFKAVLAEPQFARYVKEDIAACPTYGVNKIYNMMLGVCQRDPIQVCERIIGDARIKSNAIKQAAEAFKKSCEAVVIKQSMNERYADRRGPTLYLPLHGFEYDERLTKTSLLTSTAFEPFTRLIAKQPLSRTLLDSISYEVQKVQKRLRKKSHPTPPSPAPGTPGGTPPGGTQPGNGTQPASGTQPANGVTQPANGASPTATPATPSGLSAAMRQALADDELSREAESLQSIARVHKPWYKQVYNAVVATPVTIAATVVGAAAGAALGAVILTPVGTLLGLHAGLTGHSIVQRWENEEPTPAPAPTPAGTPSGTSTPPSSPGGNAPGPLPFDEDFFGEISGSVTRIAVQGALFPMETGGELIRRGVSYKMGNAAGVVAGTTLGTASGAVGGALTGVLLGGAAGGFIAKKIARGILGPRYR